MRSIPLFITALLFSSSCLSQSLFNKLNGTETTFHFTSNQDTLAVSSQGIISKGVKESNKSAEYDKSNDADHYGESGSAGYGYGYGYGYGFQAYHLDFIITSKIKIVDFPVIKLVPNHIEVLLFDKENRNIITLNSMKHSIIETIDNRGYSAFSIDINNIPITLISETTRIDIRKLNIRLFIQEELEAIKKEKIKILKPKINNIQGTFWIPKDFYPMIK